MSPSFPYSSRRRASLAAGVALMFALGARPCGPDFPNRYFDAPEGVLLAAPAAVFADEVRALTGSLPASRRAVPTTRVEVLAADVQELRAALRRLGRTEDEINVTADDYARSRSELDSNPRDRFSWPPAADVPPEFALYFEGATAWQGEHVKVAREKWEELLKLPDPERRFRTTWAAFMIGRSWEWDVVHGAGDVRIAAAARARAFYQRTRADAAGEFADVLGLGVASLGREARVEYLMGNHQAAIQLYASQLAAGDASAVNSLQEIVGSLVRSESPRFNGLARDPLARGVVTAWFLSRARSMRDPARAVPHAAALERWAFALRDSGIAPGDTPSADHLAWLAYHAGQYPLAEQWLALAAPDAVLAGWIRAKLALRAGDLSTAEPLLAAVTIPGRLSAAHRALALAELGRTRLALDDRDGALAAWMDGGHWTDAAFVAEQVMTLAELRAFVDRSVATDDVELHEDWELRRQPEALPARLRYLLGRRTLREGEADAAVKYLPEALRPIASDYLASVRKGHDRAAPVAERAAGFWHAAQLIRTRGLELWATELDPDWAIYDANFDLGSSRASRGKLSGPLAPSGDERERLEANPGSAPRFSYRYRAADLAWWAASLLPNDAEQTAEILVEAGGWLKARDPAAAERLYQALVIRCGNTALGQAAAKKRWFPIAPERPGESADPAP